jgi:hypothetical protein
VDEQRARSEPFVRALKPLEKMIETARLHIREFIESDFPVRLASAVTAISLSAFESDGD